MVKNTVIANIIDPKLALKGKDLSKGHHQLVI